MTSCIFENEIYFLNNKNKYTVVGRVSNIPLRLSRAAKFSDGMKQEIFVDHYIYSNETKQSRLKHD